MPHSIPERGRELTVAAGALLVEDPPDHQHASPQPAGHDHATVAARDVERPALGALVEQRQHRPATSRIAASTNENAPHPVIEALTDCSLVDEPLSDHGLLVPREEQADKQQDRRDRGQTALGGELAPGEPPGERRSWAAAAAAALYVCSVRICRVVVGHRPDLPLKGERPMLLAATWRCARAGRPATAPGIHQRRVEHDLRRGVKSPRVDVRLAGLARPDLRAVLVHLALDADARRERHDAGQIQDDPVTRLDP